MLSGLIIHIEVGKDKRTEIFSAERIRIGSDDNCDLQIRSKIIPVEGIWLELVRENGSYRIIGVNDLLKFHFNDSLIQNYKSINDGDKITSEENNISLSFFALNSESSLIKVNREQRQFAHFIEEAAIESAASPKPDEAKAFLREFVRELSREISLTTKLIALVITVGFLSGIFYLGYGFYRELKRSREQTQGQYETIKKLEEQLGQTNEKIGNLDKTNKDIIKTVSLAPNLRVQYGNGVCLIVGSYDLVDKRNGKTLRYPEPVFQNDPYEPAPVINEEGFNQPLPVSGLTTEGNGTPVEYDFIGTGFHVGGGFVLTNRHVLQPWSEDDMVKQLIKQSNGRARIKKLVVYFPSFPQPFPIKVQQVDNKEDLGIATIDPNLVSPDIPVLPLDSTTESVAIGKTVVTMGYPNGPDRFLAMLDDDELKSISNRFGNSKQSLIAYLSQVKKITPLTTPGAITDLDSKRIVHDAKTAEGGSGAPLFGQSGKVIGVNFGIFTESNAANMAIPIRFGIELLKRTGWKSPDEAEAEKNAQTQTTTVEVNPSTDEKPQ